MLGQSCSEDCCARSATTDNKGWPRYPWNRKTTVELCDNGSGQVFYFHCKPVAASAKPRRLQANDDFGARLLPCLFSPQLEVHRVHAVENGASFLVKVYLFSF